ncbi:MULTISPECIES: TetR/AcrR family transcriptional regulator [unclassified Nocardia]|uniref:TetR/AcrR family transcriptional regulator n=1 Tax=unclassified Nocardia TaxID=2637762 RepID=UPI0035D8AE1D
MTDRDPTDEKILDAALARILQVGIRRSTLDDIARRAGMNRVTIYRRFTTKENVVEAVMARELQRALADITAAGSAVSGVEAQIEETMVELIRQIRTHPMVTQLIHVDTDDALTFYTVRARQLVEAGITYIIAYSEYGQAQGTLQPYDARPVAELLARMAHSILLTPVGGVDFDDEQQTRAFVRAAVVPLLIRGIGAEPVATPRKRAAPAPRTTPAAKRASAKSTAAAKKPAPAKKTAVAKKTSATKKSVPRKK